jgi:Ser/Thr protein kinase RdoA (MazF antagonist)
MTVSSAQAIAAAFGAGRPLGFERVTRGAMGAVWKLSTSAGHYAAKEPFWFEWQEEAVAEEVAFRAVCATAGVPSPEPVTTPAGGHVADCNGTTWRLYRWADGVVPSHSDVDVTVWVAGQMGAMHSLDWQTGDHQPEPWYHRVDVEWDELAGRAAAAGVDWAGELGRLVPLCAELTSLVNSAPIGDMVWCHRDLTNTNVLRSAAGRVLVDWDNAGPMAPWRELGAVLVNHVGAEGNLRRIVDAYRAADGPGEIAGPEGFATGLAILLNHLNGQVSAALDTALAPEHREYAVTSVLGLLRAMPEVGTLERAGQVVRR